MAEICTEFYFLFIMAMIMFMRASPLQIRQFKKLIAHRIRNQQNISSSKTKLYIL